MRLPRVAEGCPRDAACGSQHDARDYRSRELFRDLCDGLGQANTLANLGVVHSLTGDYRGAARDLQEACDLYVKLGNRFGEASALIDLGQVQMPAGDYPAAASNPTPGTLGVIVG